MKVAFAGKGGSGKTTLASLLVRILAEENRRVLAVDADPNSNLGKALGFARPEEIKPIVEMKDLIYERMDIKGDPKGSFYKLNPRIDDIPEKFTRTKGNINLIVMGTVDAGGSGCVCPESTFLKEMLKTMVLREAEDIVMDMEAGIEHLGRSTAVSMDCVLAVVEASSASCEAARRIQKLSRDLKMKTFFLGNKISNAKDKEFLFNSVEKDSIIGLVAYCEDMKKIDMAGSIMDIPRGSGLFSQVEEIKVRLLEPELKNDKKKVAG